MPRRIVSRTVLAASICLVASGATLTGQTASAPTRALTAPPLNLSPDAAYADAKRMFQGIPGIERSPAGRLWATWYGGGVTEDHHNYVMLVTSGDDGASWSGLKLVIDPDGDGPTRAFDPCLWLDPTGRLWLFWAQRAPRQPAHLWAIMTETPDAPDARWSGPRPICPGVMMNKPIVTRRGEWLLPVAHWGREGSAGVVRSADGGVTFERIGGATVRDRAQRDCDEHMLIERRDGSLWVLVRTKYGIGQSVSTDGGRTWADVSPWTVAHATARFFIRRLRSGRLLLVKHGPLDRRTGRSHLTAYLSDDDGRTWTGALLLDARPGVSYPDGFQAPDGRIYVIYDLGRAGPKEILLAVFTEADVAAGKPGAAGRGRGARLRVVVNKATGVNPRHGRLPANVKFADNADGAAMLAGPRPRIEASEGEIATVVKGETLFNNRTYRFKNAPECLVGKRFLRGTIDRIDAVCTQPGVVFVITPSTGRNRDSLAEPLAKAGFVKVRLPEFHLFGSAGNICSTWQKRVEPGEAITLGKWGVLIW